MRPPAPCTHGITRFQWTRFHRKMIGVMLRPLLCSPCSHLPGRSHRGEGVHCSLGVKACQYGINSMAYSNWPRRSRAETAQSAPSRGAPPHSKNDRWFHPTYRIHHQESGAIPGVILHHRVDEIRTCRLGRRIGNQGLWESGEEEGVWEYEMLAELRSKTPNKTICFFKSTPNIRNQPCTKIL